MLNDTIVSIIRTVIPSLIGSLAFLLINAGIDVDTEAWVAVLTPLAIGVYYAVARLLERKVPAAGWLLGVPKPPTY